MDQRDGPTDRHRHLYSHATGFSEHERERDKDFFCGIALDVFLSQYKIEKLRDTMSQRE